MAVAIETVGSLIKIDEVVTVEHNILPNSLVLETVEPYPDYHGSEPGNDKPNLIFLVTQEEYEIEYFMRINNRVKNHLNFPLDATPSILKIYTEVYNGIRIRGLKNFSQIKQIQEIYASEGLKLAKKKTIKAPAYIHLKKSYILDKYDDGVYKDLLEPMMWYFSIPVKLDWVLLKTATQQVKNNIENTNFDVAFGWLFTDGITDIIRIYAGNFNLDDIKILRSKYLEELHKLHKI
jgi:hypothetical protein